MTAPLAEKVKETIAIIEDEIRTLKRERDDVARAANRLEEIDARILDCKRGRESDRRPRRSSAGVRQPRRRLALRRAATAVP